jgi:hypothetical protein
MTLTTRIFYLLQYIYIITVKQCVICFKCHFRSQITVKPFAISSFTNQVLVLCRHFQFYVEIIVHYATRFINGPFDTSFIRQERSECLVKECLKKFINELHTILFLRPNGQCKYST